MPIASSLANLTASNARERSLRTMTAVINQWIFLTVDLLFAHFEYIHRKQSAYTYTYKCTYVRVYIQQEGQLIHTIYIRVQI
mmetsp:Transcript_38087/g.98352  ORF Transcript_38087/g.98352 Transcript_38087/m.98352 type:complete len:82 (+) Transcript_38087:907-1152(+)